MSEFEIERTQMVAAQLAARGIRDERVLEVMRRVPRHRFFPQGSDASRTYADGAAPIGEGQTISQPFIVALMTEALALSGDETVLEIGAGSGYQTAILAALCRRVYAIERHAPLANRAGTVLRTLGIQNVELLIGDGSRGLPEFAPYDAILIAAVAPSVPPALLSQLKDGGRLVLPVGIEGGSQELLLYQKSGFDLVLVRNLGAVSFVPLVGSAGFGFPDDLGDMDI